MLYVVRVDFGYSDRLLGTKWDALGPIPQEFFRWDQVRPAIDAHFNKQGISTFFDISGLKPSQQKLISDYVKKIFGGTRQVILGD